MLPRTTLRVNVARRTLKVGGDALAIVHWVTGDTLPLTFAIKDQANAALPLTDYAGKFYMRKRGAYTNKVDGTAVVITTAASGECEYRWEAADVDTPGQYDCEIEFTDKTGRLVTTEPRAAFILVMRSGLG